MRTFCILFLAVVSAKLVNDQAEIDRINSLDTTWRAGANKRFEGVAAADIKQLLGVKGRPTSLPVNNSLPHIKDLPETFDARERWPGCITDIRDQRMCAGCWAFGASEALSDRLNIFNNFCSANKKMLLSPQHLIDCDKASGGCDGGYTDKAWVYMMKNGIMSEDCYPFSSAEGETGKCQMKKEGAKCPSGDGKQVFYHAASAFMVPKGEEAIKQELYQNGPIEVQFAVYHDFLVYESGVYHHESEEMEGYHAVKLIGWGVEKQKKKSVPYWICSNSWGEEWGMSGYFYILRGKNECEIEDCGTAGLPTKV